METGIWWLVMAGFFVSWGNAEDRFPIERADMVETQLRARGISDEKVLAVMGKTPREVYMPEEYRSRAYTDGPVPIGYGQTISQPYIVAFMTQALAPRENDRVLEIGTGSGYQAAVLAPLVKEVFTIEIVESLAKQAEEALRIQGLDNVMMRTGDGYGGWPENAPFDAIIVTCAPDHVPQPLVDQLKEGGRMIIPVGEEGGVQQLVLLQKNGKEIQRTAVLDVRFVPLTRGKNQSSANILP